MYKRLVNEINEYHKMMRNKRIEIMENVTIQFEFSKLQQCRKELPEYGCYIFYLDIEGKGFELIYIGRGGGVGTQTLYKRLMQYRHLKGTGTKTFYNKLAEYGIAKESVCQGEISMNVKIIPVSDDKKVVETEGELIRIFQPKLNSIT